MAESVQLKRMSVRHDAIAEFLIANPNMRMGAVAAAFGVSPAWLSTIIHSDIFQEYYKRVKGEFIDTRILPLRDKLMGIVDTAVDRLAEQAQVADTKTTLDIADRILGRLGYGTKPQGPTTIVQNNVVMSSLTPQELADARSRYRAMQQALAADTGLPVLNGGALA